MSYSFLHFFCDSPNSCLLFLSYIFHYNIYFLYDKGGAFCFSTEAVYIVHYLQYVHFFITPPPFTPRFLDPSVLVGASYLMCLSLSSNLLLGCWVGIHWILLISSFSNILGRPAISILRRLSLRAFVDSTLSARDYQCKY